MASDDDFEYVPGNPVLWINRNAVWIMTAGFLFLFVKALATGNEMDFRYAAGAVSMIIGYFGIRWVQKYLMDI